MQMGRNNQNMEKQQSEVDRLNRSYDAFMSAQNREEYDQTSTESQATWLERQAELV
jgi:hypothetical protein